VSWEVWSVYAAVVAVICITPGPAVLFVVSQSGWRGARAGVGAALGIESANSVLWMLAALGLVAVIAASHTVFVTLKWAGAAYLAWLGVQAIRGSFKPAAPLIEARASRAAYRDGVVVGMSNPKTLLFFVAFLPQFIDPAAPGYRQIAKLAVTAMGIDLAVLAVYALSAGWLRRVLARAGVRRWFDRGVGAVFLVLAGAAVALRRAG
jgi:threonine/homoserine/homoserine lactone efflux protein